MTDTTGRHRPTVRPQVDNSALTRRADSKAASGRPPPVPTKAKAAIEIMLVTPGHPDYQDLAKQVGYPNARALRKALSLAQSVRYQRERKAEVLAQINLHNPAALQRVRDGSDNGMAVTAAVRQLESMENVMEEQHGGRSAPPAPGVVIVIEQAGRPDRIIGSPQPVIDARPDEFGPAD